MEGLSYLNDERFYSPTFCSLSPSLSFPQSSREALEGFTPTSHPELLVASGPPSSLQLMSASPFHVFRTSGHVCTMKRCWDVLYKQYHPTRFCNFLFKANIMLLKCIQVENILHPFKLLYGTVLYKWLAIYFYILLISIWDSPLHSVLTMNTHVTVNIALWCI